MHQPFVLAALGATLLSCFAGRPLERRAAVRNGPVVSEFIAREHAGGHTEGNLGFAYPTTRSYLYEELAARDIRPDQLGPLNRIRDRQTLLAVMNTFTRALGVQCNFCHREDNWAAPTPRKVVTAYMWDHFVHDLEFRDGRAVYCDSCHHATTVFLRRSTSQKPWLLAFMQTEYVNQLRRRDGRAMGCATCHATPFNPRFLPRAAEPVGYRAPWPHPDLHGGSSTARNE